MISRCLVPSRCLRRQIHPACRAQHPRRNLLTLAIETSCDDTSVAILETTSATAKLHFHKKITSNNTAYKGIHPLIAVESHQENLAALVEEALPCLPDPSTHHDQEPSARRTIYHNGQQKMKPDFISVTRGPGMRSSLQTGIDTAKGLALAWNIPILGINHMQAHALTPRLTNILSSQSRTSTVGMTPSFPYLTFLVSGGHTLLVHTQSTTAHDILCSTEDIPIGNCLDRCAKAILPQAVLSSHNNVSYGPALESFANSNTHLYNAPANNKESNKIKDTPYDWKLTPPYCTEHSSEEKRARMAWNFSSIITQVTRFLARNPDMAVEEREYLAHETQRVAFEHLVSRLFLLNPSVLHSTTTIVISGGVACNKFLSKVLAECLTARGHKGVNVICPPIEYCTDNAAMIAWAGMEMWREGWQSGVKFRALNKWSIDPGAEDGGIMGAGDFVKRLGEV